MSDTAIQVGQPVDVVPFGSLRGWRGALHDLEVHDVQPDAAGLLRPHVDPQSGQWHLGVEWDEPRDVRQVVVRFPPGAPVPADLRVEYWRHSWPTPAPERWVGARRGWIGRDDPYNGHWVTAKAELRREGSVCTFVFDPVDIPELRAGAEAFMATLPSAVRGALGYYSSFVRENLEESEHFLARFRRTLKIRVAGSGEPPALAALEATTDAVWQEEEVEVWFEQPGDWSGTVEVVNGRLLERAGLGFEAQDSLTGAAGWACQGAGKGVRLRLLSTHCPRGSNDQTIVTLCTAARSFSFLPADLADGPIAIPAYGVWVKRAGDPVRWEEHLAHLRATRPRTIYERVEDEPEQSYERAAREIPALDVTKQAPFGRYLPLGVDSGRQEFALRYNGELFAAKQFLKLRGRDAARLLWPGTEIHYRFPTGDPLDYREGGGATQQRLLEGWLPVVISEWLDREIHYEQTAFAALLDGPMTPPEARRGDEDIVVLLRFVIRNATHGAKRARLWLVIAPQEELALEPLADGAQAVVARGRVVPDVPVARLWRVQPYEAEYLRATVQTAGRGRLTASPIPGDGSQAVATGICYDVLLEGGEAQTVTLAVPFVTFLERADWQRVAAVDFEAKRADVVGYWRALVGAGGEMDIPDTILSDFHKAARTHVAISVDKDPVSGMYMVPAATYTYGVCANEACWQIHMLEQAGYHQRAEEYLETFLRTQGATKLDGDFASAEGTLLGLELDEGQVRISHFNYNLDHGVVMESLADHYRYTGDRAWAERVAPNLVAACDLIVRERTRTQRRDRAGNPVPEWGLLPPGHLEDNPEWRYWFAVNAHAYNGMQRCAEVLAEIGHPDGERLLREAAAYREDIRQAARRAMIEAPVVRLPDGTYIPHIPTRAGTRNREWGWIREAAYGALHLLEGNVFDPHEEEMTFVLQDLEDNLFVTRDFGRPVDRERFWFSHGGVTIQANLMDTAIDYLRRGQIRHGLRSLFNNFGASLYADVRCFTEHPVIELGHGVGPFYKVSDEAKALVWLRAFLVREEGDTLHLAPGAPRAYFAAGQSFGVRKMATFFGPLGYRVHGGAASVDIHVEVPARQPPRALVIHVRRPDGQPMRAVTVNGQPHSDFDPATERVRIVAPAGALVVHVEYAQPLS
jgi:hypothetical protein